LYYTPLDKLKEIGFFITKAGFFLDAKLSTGALYAFIETNQVKIKELGTITLLREISVHFIYHLE
jgi:hypothetical protein